MNNKYNTDGSTPSDKANNNLAAQLPKSRIPKRPTRHSPRNHNSTYSPEYKHNHFPRDTTQRQAITVRSRVHLTNKKDPFVWSK
jgi:hypothetical protein